MTPEKRRVEINISAIPVGGVGGLGLVAMATVVSVFFPAIGWMMAAGVASGILLAAALVLFRRAHRSAGPSGDEPKILFRKESAKKAEADLPPEGGDHLLQAEASY